MGTSNQLSRFETCHRLSATCCMPYMTAPLCLRRVLFPVSLRHPISDTDCSIILITSHNLKQIIICISNRIKSDQHMCHRNIQKSCRNLVPFIDWHVVKVCPMKKERRIKNTILSRICEIYSLFRLHRNKYLNQRKNTPEHTFMRILYDLVIRITHRNIASL